MLKIENTKAQAAIELAVFGAIIIFVLGTIIRSALGNAYSQNENFKAMRMAMLASWQGARSATGKGALANTSRNSASILIIEDRLSPDFNKFGAIDRNPYVAQGAGTFTYNLYYPWQPGVDNPSQLIPVMDIWINGQHFPLSTATYVTQTLSPPQCQAGVPDESLPLTQGQCLQNQCLRNQREWVGGIVNADMFDNVMPAATLDAATLQGYGQAIFHSLIIAGVVTTSTGSTIATSGKVALGFSTMPSPFSINDPTTNLPVLLTQQEINTIQNILISNAHPSKLFYTREVNGTTQFITTPPGSCTGTDNALCSSLTVLDANGNPHTNTNGDMQFDLMRNGDYVAVDNQFPSGGALRNDIAWEWAASNATSATSIGLDATSNTFPTYDIDGRLKEVTVYGFSISSDGFPTVSYEDFQGGDIDSTWDEDSCGLKPGLLQNTQLYTQTMAGTYLEIKEGQLYNPETDQFVRSVNKQDTIDVIQRMIQLSNNTNDFCQGSTPQAVVNGSPDPNPVEVCLPQGSGDNCFTSGNISRTCFDGNSNIIFARSRLSGQGGHYWITDTAGQLQVH